MLSVLDPCTIIRVQSWDPIEEVPSRVEQIVGAPWPKVTGTFARGRFDIVCVGPTDWLVIAALSAGVSLLPSLDEVFAQSTYRATDISFALTRIQLEGTCSRALLGKGCSLILHPEEFAVGQSARTRFAGMPVVVRCLQPSAFECIVASSYRDYLVGWLEDAAMEFQSFSMSD